MYGDFCAKVFSHAIKACEVADMESAEMLVDIFDSFLTLLSTEEKTEELIEVKVKLHLYYAYVRRCLSLNRLDYNNFDEYFRI